MFDYSQEFKEAVKFLPGINEILSNEIFEEESNEIKQNTSKDTL